MLGEGYHRCASHPVHAEGLPLTERQKEVLRLYAEGWRRPEIGKKLAISSKTIDGHCSNAKSRLGARTTTQAVAMYARGAA